MAIFLLDLDGILELDAEVANVLDLGTTEQELHGSQIGLESVIA
jgi:hypothetical protein